MSTMGFVLFWLALAVLMIVIEVSTVSLVSIWFAAGALVAAVLAFFQIPVWIQVAVFLAVSGILFFFFKKKIFQFFRFRHDQSGAAQVLGQTGEVLIPIAPGQDGRVRVQGLDWKATSDEPIAAGQHVRITGMQGVTLHVQRTLREEEIQGLTRGLRRQSR